ncbi:MAG TPA: tRNA (adenosine(37)-N6)-threonylcarbamoyltransferase complex ATPase subunit type 1 TsaE [Desulfomonilia bacterium]|nr:tRNA (adenosine(37)-N6)-threonylcarbamoyltransferase complex ATPase subunit type 1 TsaE [Desulfomonilia bacterium]
MKQEFISKSPEDTYSLGIRIGSLLKGGELILLNGELGAGKTLLTKGIVAGLEPHNPTTVVSPSFTLVNLYNARLDIIHVDLYRLDSEEIGNLGLEDFMDKNHIIIVEWAERVHGFFIGTTVDVTIEHSGESSRRITISAELPWIEYLAG